MLYFAYGVNLNPEVMSERCPKARMYAMGRLVNYSLCFPRFSVTWGGGVSSVKPSIDKEVWGVLFDLSFKEIKVLDRYEGFSSPVSHLNSYDRDVVNVQAMRHGKVSERPALVYIARWDSDNHPPAREYLKKIIQGARHHSLPPEYIRKLEELESR